MHNQDSITTLQSLKDIMKEIIAERDWQQFHSPKNLALKLSLESSELLEKFEWMKEEDSFAHVDKNRQEIEDEAADVLIVLLSFCNTANIDISAAMMHKLQEVKAKYPVEKAKGVYTKYDKL
jgi:dCTP diphosphatase